LGQYLGRLQDWLCLSAARHQSNAISIKLSKRSHLHPPSGRSHEPADCLSVSPSSSQVSGLAGNDMATSTFVVPLTTTFTPPPSCLASTYSVAPYGRDSITVEYDNYAAVRGMDPICYPGNFYLIRTTDSAGESAAQYYSPGFCPASYITATIGSGLSGATDTTVTCCPS